MEMKSPPPCPNTVTVRRNPPRRARPTPHSAAPLSLPPSSKPSSAIRSFPIHDILAIDIPDNQQIPELSSPPKEPSDSEKLRVFLRIRPILTNTASKVGSVKYEARRNVWPQNPNRRKDSSKTGKKKSEICLKINDCHSVTLCPPQSVADVRRTKSEVYEGFSYVFTAESTQNEVYEQMVNPLVVDFLKGKSGMLAAMGPSGSGKTHTVFGSTREPGMVPLALRQIFSEKESCRSKYSRTFYLSMFEIYSERGKGEKIMDLSQERGDLSMQQSNIKGLQEVVIHDVQQAESLIANGMFKRSTAMTNSNIQSSRSQCIINIRCDKDDPDESHLSTSILTIVDLAGAEREKRTGNQGARLLESNFINNTSMVFGLCLRSLLEHQKNPKKPLHKHFQNSMLTKYLRDFLEGKKRMALILTVKSAEDDYQDTSYLLRQASPFMNIKFENVEEQPANTYGNKRRTQTLPKAEHAKRMRFNSNEDEVKGGILHQPHKEELIPEQDEEVKTYGEANKDKSIKETITDSAKKARENQILLNFSRALWKVLQEYKNKLESSENEVDSLRHSLTLEKGRCVALETELNLMKASCSSGKVTRSVSLHSDCSDMVNLENQKNSAPCEYVVFDKDDLTELGDIEFNNEVPVCGALESAVSDSELLVHAYEVSSFVKEYQRKHEEEESSAQVSFSDPSKSEYIQDILDDNVAIDPEIRFVEAISISSDRDKYEEESDEKVGVLGPNVLFDDQDFKEVEERETNGEITGCENLKRDVSDSELLMHVEQVSCFVKEDPRQHEEEDSNAQVSSSNPYELECFEKQNVFDDSGLIPVEVTSIFSNFEKFDENSYEGLIPVEVTSIFSNLEKFEEQSNEKVDVLSPNIVSDKQEFNEDEERETNGETTGCDTSDSAGQKSELTHVVGDESSSTLKEDQPEHEEKKEVPDRQLVLPEDVITSNASKLPDATSVQPCQPAKPKRRLRPASSVMLRNISISDFDDATEKPKQRHGKRGENEDGSKKTQGSITLLRILQQNLPH